MRFPIISKTALVIFVVATIMVEDTLTKSFAQNDDSLILNAGILNSLTNETCVDENPFPDPDDITSYYQCYWFDDYYVILHFQCSRGGYYDAANGDCFPLPPFV
ncbi:uncharacterized protein LOC110850002 [Folsomia candida]|uniref:uncharacterized protein LOC110850002 n=1 Tax=Folsomia candida TaxID=158441 RepID=UPI000B8F6CBD|nr:uncharacterized protein LOC110850002 [Folsomia candida]